MKCAKNEFQCASSRRWTIVYNVRDIGHIFKYTSKWAQYTWANIRNICLWIGLIIFCWKFDGNDELCL